jgi:uncharacterized membrane protein
MPQQNAPPADKKADKKTSNSTIEGKSKIHKHRTDGLSLFITNTFGSIAFLFVCAAFVIFWICCNLNFIPYVKPFDPFPFPELEMVVSIFAIILSVSVLISQKRQARLEKIHQQVEFEINVTAEKEITKVLEMLHSIQKKLGIEQSDQELEKMMARTDLEALHRDAEEK